MKIPQAFRLSLVVGLTTAALVWMSAGNVAAQTVTVAVVGSSTVSEGDSGYTPVTFTVSMSRQPFFPTSITFGISGGTATIGDDRPDDDNPLYDNPLSDEDFEDYNDKDGVDYVPWFPARTTDGRPGPSHRLLFTRTNWWPRTFTIQVRGDTRHEPDETIIVAVAGRGVTDDGRATVTIEDDDAPPSLSINSPSVTEGDDLIYTVSLNTASQTLVAVGYTVSAGTATPGTDYRDVSSGTLTFAAEETRRDWSGGYAGGGYGEAALRGRGDKQDAHRFGDRR